MKLHPIFSTQIAEQIGQLRAAPFRADGQQCLLLAHSADFDVDPYTEMFFFPTDTLHLTALDMNGHRVWTRDLGRGVVPGMWFCPVLPFDLDQDGNDEIFFVGNMNAKHPLAHNSYRLMRLDARTGQTTGEWAWSAETRNDTLGCAFRNFLAGGYASGKPVLVSAQGTYHAMDLQGWNPDMTRRWRHFIPADAKGARGSHRCVIADLNNSGQESLLWGERCIRLDDGHELFCCDRETWNGHSDRIDPLRLDNGDWSIFTIRESQSNNSPRVVMFDQAGQTRWSAVSHGHMDMGWIARVLDHRQHAALAIRIGNKTCGPDGRFHTDMDEFYLDAASGAPLATPMSLYQTQPIDFNGDGFHELIRADPGSDGAVFDRHGKQLGSVGGPCALLQKISQHPGEQALSYHSDGVVKLWHDADAIDSPLAIERYTHPMYLRNAAMMSTGSNMGVLGGL